MPCERSSRTRSASPSSLVTIAPPSPTARFLLEKNENAPRGAERADVAALLADADGVGGVLEQHQASVGREVAQRSA